MKLASAVVSAVVMIAAAQAADGIKAGQWEYTAQVRLPNMPKLPPGVTLPPGVNIGAGGINVTRTQCVTEKRPFPSDMHRSGQQQGDCRVANVDVSGGTVHWDTTCSQKDGSTVHAEGVAHYTGDTMEATMKTRISGGGNPPTETSQHVIGRYLGPCDGK